MIQEVVKNIYRFTLSEFYTNNYCFIKNGKVLIIDSTESKPIINFIKEKKLKVAGLILTHGHVDHICGAKSFQQFNIIPLMNKNDDIQIKISQSIYKEYGFEEEPLFNYQHIEEGKLKIDEFEIEVIETPGHTEGSISLLIDGILFSGDTLFKGSIGRTDLIGGCLNQILKSIKNKLLVLPNDTIVLPGHGEKTTIGEEKLNNPFIKEVI